MGIVYGVGGEESSIFFMNLCCFIVISLYFIHYVCVVWVCEFNFSGFFGCFPGFFFLAVNFKGLFSGSLGFS